MTNRTLTQEVITEEQAEESNQKSKRTSKEAHSIVQQKTLASVTSAPNLNQSNSTTKVKTVNLVSIG